MGGLGLGRFAGDEAGTERFGVGTGGFIAREGALGGFLVGLRFIFRLGIFFMGAPFIRFDIFLTGTPFICFDISVMEELFMRLDIVLIGIPVIRFDITVIEACLICFDMDFIAGGFIDWTFLLLGGRFGDCFKSRRPLPVLGMVRDLSFNVRLSS